MKKYNLILSVLLVFCFLSCEQDMEMVATPIEVVSQQLRPGLTSTTLVCEFQTDATLEKVKVQYSLSSNFQDFIELPMTQETEYTFYATISGLQENTTYYTRYIVSNRYSTIDVDFRGTFKVIQSEMAIQSINVNGVSFKMMPVQGGTFLMGKTLEQGTDAYSDETPTHTVVLSDFYIGETEVTQALWVAVMGSNPSYSFLSKSLPVERVSWDDCQTFISKLNQLTGKNFRLPTEAEWEYAARGGQKSKGSKYAGSKTVDDVAWYVDNSGDKTHVVKSKAANELGLYDMSGNVYEWCQDWYGTYSSSLQTNPTGPSSGVERVMRGGSYGCQSRGCRVSYRNSSLPSEYYIDVGLRIVLVP